MLRSGKSGSWSTSILERGRSMGEAWAREQRVTQRATQQWSCQSALEALKWCMRSQRRGLPHSAHVSLSGHHFVDSFPIAEVSKAAAKLINLHNSVWVLEGGAGEMGAWEEADSRVGPGPLLGSSSCAEKAWRCPSGGSYWETSSWLRLKGSGWCCHARTMFIVPITDKYATPPLTV